MIIYIVIQSCPFESFEPTVVGCYKDKEDAEKVANRIGTGVDYWSGELTIEEHELKQMYENWLEGKDFEEALEFLKKNIPGGWEYQFIS